MRTSQRTPTAWRCSEFSTSAQGCQSPVVEPLRARIRSPEQLRRKPPDFVRASDQSREHRPRVEISFHRRDP